MEPPIFALHDSFKNYYSIKVLMKIIIVGIQNLVTVAVNISLHSLERN